MTFLRARVGAHLFWYFILNTYNLCLLILNYYGEEKIYQNALLFYFYTRLKINSFIVPFQTGKEGFFDQTPTYLIFIYKNYINRIQPSILTFFGQFDSLDLDFGMYRLLYRSLRIIPWELWRFTFLKWFFLYALDFTHDSGDFFTR